MLVTANMGEPAQKSLRGNEGRNMRKLKKFITH